MNAVRDCQVHLAKLWVAWLGNIIRRTDMESLDKTDRGENGFGSTGK
jgi:dUTPase